MKKTISFKDLQIKSKDSRTAKLASPKKEYKKPELFHYGKVKDLTHFSSILGIGDTQFPNTRP